MTFIFSVEKLWVMEFAWGESQCRVHTAVNLPLINTISPVKVRYSERRLYLQTIHCIFRVHLLASSEISVSL